MFLSRSSALSVLLAGCGSLSYYGPPDRPEAPLQSEDPGTRDSGTDGPVGTSTDEPVELLLAGVEPAFGSNGGGAVVTLTGSFDAATEVTFAGEPAAVTQRTATELEVEVPASTAVGAVDVEVVSGGRSDRLAEGFVYHGDATGQAGSIGWIDYFDVVGGYWADATNFATGRVAFVDGESDWEMYQEFSGAVGSCTFVYEPPTDPLLVETGAASLSFSGTSAFSLTPDADLGAGWYSASLTEAQVVRGGTYDLAPVEGAADWPTFGVTQAVTIPESYILTTPAVDSTEAPPMTRSQTFTWTGSGGDYMILYLLRQYVQNNQAYYDGYVTCVMPDTGSFTVPDLWDDWFLGDFMHIRLGRVVVDAQPLPHTNAEHRVAGISWIYGGAITN